MLQIETINEAIATAVILDKRDVYLSPESGSPLERLVNLSTVVETKPGVQETDYVPNAETISSDSITATDEHSAELEKFSDDIAGYVQNHLNFSKNTVKPIIELSVNLVKERWDSLSNIVPELKIIQTDISEPAQVASFRDMVEEYKDINYSPYSFLIPTSVEMSVPDIIELIKTGDVDIDNAVSLMNARLGDSFISSVFDAIFKFTDKPIQQLLDDRKDGLDVATIAFLIANKVYDAPFEGIKLDLVKFNDLIDMIRKQAAYRLNNGYIAANKNYKTKLLITEYTSSNITVNAPVYKEWIDNGGSDVILFGNVCSKNPKLYVDDINENKQEYIDRWKQECNTIITMNNVKSFSLKKDVIYNSILNVVQENFALCYGHLVPEGVEPSTSIPEYQLFLTKLSEQVNNLRESDLLNVWSIVTDLVCDTVFYYTASKDILKGVEEAMKLNKELSLREALLLSTVDYVAEYVANQIVKN